MVCNGVETDLSTDPLNCGACGMSCQGGTCTGGSCGDSSCTPGTTAACYDGAAGTEGVGACVGGMKTCQPSGLWGLCDGEVVPTVEVCNDHIDNDCNGMVDEDIDADGDGFTTCGGDCCDNASLCSDPKLVNPGAFEVAGNGVDDDCDGIVDEAVATTCDTGLASNSANAMDAAKAMELCQTATMTDKNWGVISATWTLADGTSVPNALSRALRPHYGTGTLPKAGANMVLISTGNAAGEGDTNPAPDTGEDGVMNTSSGFPADFLAANGGTLPNAPGCPAPSGSTANDPVMLTLTIRVPTNASSFTLQTNFFSSEFPEWTCSEFNDFFVVLLDSTWTGTPANPHDKNLATYTDSMMHTYPVGVNLAYGNTGLFTQCVNGPTGCEATHTGTISSCTGTGDLAGTGMETSDPIAAGLGCTGAETGGATGWLTTSGNVVGGEIIKLRIAIWDTSDHDLDSLAVIDNFQWSVQASQPGTIIE